MDRQWDVVIIGAGPAGLSAAVYTGRANLKTVILERGVPGGQIMEAYDVDNYPGYPEGLSGPELTEKMVEHAKKFGPVLEAATVEDITLDGPYKVLETSAGRMRAPIVIIASGADHRKLDAPGEAELAGRGVSYCATCDGPMPVFRNQHLVCIGGGDAAVTEAIFLSRFASKVSIIHRRLEFRAQASYVDEARENEKIDFVLDSVVTRVNGNDQVESVTVRNVKSDEESDLLCRGVFVFIGHVPNTDFVKTILPGAVGAEIEVDLLTMETAVPGVYAVGDVRKGSARQIATSGGDAVTAAVNIQHRIRELLGT
jgi:thioredoxin reductase (NADPH)